MSKIFSTFFLLIINFIIKFPFFLSQLSEHTVQEYYGGLIIDGNNENNENKETNECLCDIDLNSCDNFCCCDNDCHEDAIKEWRAHHQCIDEKDSIGIFSDRCIDHNLIMSYARKNRRRVPENTLLLTAALSGCIGMYLTMRIIHHKTKHPKFMIGIPVIFFLELLAVIALAIALTPKL